MASASVAEAMEFLNKADSLGSKRTVYEHIKKSLLQILEQRPKDALAHFETVLLDTSKRFDSTKDAEIVNKASTADAARTVASLRLFGDPEAALNEDGEPEELAEPDEYAFFEPEAPEVAFRHLALCGVALPAAELYGVLMVAKRLGGDPDLKVEALRFFGKFLGLQADYYVFECRMNERPEKVEVDGEAEGELPPGEAPPEAEMGANKYMYFVCTSLGGPLTLLEDVTPAQIRVARTLKKVLVGDLAAPVATYPPFPGTERHYLRAQIARIAHSTVLCPAGLYTAPEEGDPEANEEYAAAPVSQMLDAGSWCHWTPHLKAMGVTVLPEVPEAEDEEAPPVLLPEQTEVGPAVLAVAESDAPVLTMPAWSPLGSSCSNNLQHQVAGLSSNLWPGAMALTDGSVWSNVYVGWGLPRSGPYTPAPPPTLMAESAALSECNDLPPPPPAPEAEEEE